MNMTTKHEDNKAEKLFRFLSSFFSTQLVRVIPKTEEQRQELIKVTSLDFIWITPVINVSVVGAPALYFARIETVEFFKKYCQKLKMDFEIVVENVQKDLVKLNLTVSNRHYKKNMSPREFNINQYHKLSEIYDFMDALKDKFPEKCSVIDIGESSEKRPMKLLKISTGENGNVKKKAIWVDGTIHAREWITTSVTTYLIYQLLLNDEYRGFIDELTWYILPVFNVDGYNYTWETDRMWRKSRSTHKSCSANSSEPECSCRGVDLNRNWNAKWNTSYVCHHWCCNTYPGESAMSEPEVRNVAKFLKDNDDHIEAYITLHNYGQLWTYPYTHSYKIYPPKISQMRELAELAADALMLKHGKFYTVGSLSDFYAKPSGSGVSTDWVVDNTKISFPYLVEVRPLASQGTFCLSESEIKPTSEEIIEGIKVIANYLMGNVQLTGFNAISHNSSRDNIISWIIFILTLLLLKTCS